jgi:glutaminyl-tRNA synthetase
MTEPSNAIKVTRFPPEPNGFLHLGHCKSIFINWADSNQCHLRLDDTNPEAEKNDFVTNIIDDIKWLGFDPGNITYTSDYFDQLYDYAILLIKNNSAYVDFTSNEEIRDQRHNGIENKFRFASVEQNLIEFEKMKNGSYLKSECVLRLKIDMQNLNHVLRDPIAYRISQSAHHRTGTKWVIYPSYDYSHGIIDALEGITHSYCTDEFYIRRDLYFWTPLKLISLGIDLKVADEIEYGKLSVENNILSKRNINKLIYENHLTDYTDPRLLTIKGLKRRGFTPDLIKQIVDCSGFDRKETIISSKYIDHVLRTAYNEIAIRVFGIINPLEVVISSNQNNTNIESIQSIQSIQLTQSIQLKQLTHPNHPFNTNMGSHQITLSNSIYIEQEDFSESEIKGYYRFMPNNIVRLRYNNDGFYKMSSYDKSDSVLTIEKADVTNINIKKIKGCIHWISKTDASRVKYELFTELAPNGEFDPNSKTERFGYIQSYAMENLNKTFQLERIGYFKFDRYESDVPVFIQIVGLYDNKKV